MLGKEKKWQRAMETEWERRSQLGLPKLAEFIYYFSGSGNLTGQCAVYHSYTPYVTDYFLFENRLFLI